MERYVPQERHVPCIKAHQLVVELPVPVKHKPVTQVEQAGQERMRVDHVPHQHVPRMHHILLRVERMAMRARDKPVKQMERGPEPTH